MDGSPLSETYLRFEVSGYGRFIRSAKLRFHAIEDDESVGGPTVALADPSWTPESATWESRPELVSGTLDASGPIAPGAWVELDVSAAVRDDGVYVFGLRPTTGDGIRFDLVSAPPELVIELEYPFAYDVREVTPAAGDTDAVPLALNADATVLVRSWKAAEPGADHHFFLQRQDGSRVPIAMPEAEGTSMSVTGMNDAEEVVGALGSNEEQVPFVWTEVGARILALPADARSCTAVSINAAGTVIGECTPAQGESYTYRWDRDGSVSRVEMSEPPDAHIAPVQINDAGEVLGTLVYDAQSVGWTTTFLHDGVLSSIATLRSPRVSSAPEPMVAGTSYGLQAMRWTAAEGLTELHPAPGMYPYEVFAYGLNDSGVVVGKGEAVVGDRIGSHGTLWLADTTPLDLNAVLTSKEHTVSEAHWINDQGVIAAVELGAGWRTLLLVPSAESCAAVR